MKVVVLKTGAACKESAGRLNAATLDRIQNAITYRIYGCETQRNKDYEAQLADYEKASVRADLPVAALPPIYKLISMTGVLLIFYFGSKNAVRINQTLLKKAGLPGILPLSALSFPVFPGCL